MILTRKAPGLQEKSKVNLALSELKASKELYDQLLKERDNNEREFLDVLNNNRKLKCEMAQLHTQHTEAIEVWERLQFVVNGFSQCSSEYEQTLHDKALFEQQLHDANGQISQLETLNLNITASLNNSLSSELVSARASQSQHIDLNSVTIDLTCDNVEYMKTNGPE
uniref:SFRICE_033493 n=1 Tax=Spodoptera frugiperda TaxID=7108 RepID=A0A2H1WB40_SPOFR